MKTVFENGRIERREKDQFLSYIIQDTALFSPMGFKVLQSGGESALLDCVKVSWNGKIKLVYSGKNYRRLDQMIGIMSSELFLKLVVNLIRAVLELKENSFIRCSNLDLAMDRIFMDWETGEIALVYLPLTEQAGMGSDIGFEKNLRDILAQWIDRYFPYDMGRLHMLAGKLCDYSCSLKHICRLYQEPVEVKTDAIQMEIIPELQKVQEEVSPVKEMIAPEPKKTEHSLRLTLVSGNGPSELRVYGTEYIIGRSLAKSNGCIQGNPRVSNVHCRIHTTEQQFFVTDAGSFNGTYLNEKKIAPNTRHELKQGDKVRMADVTYMVCIDGR